MNPQTLARDLVRQARGLEDIARGLRERAHELDIEHARNGGGTLHGRAIMDAAVKVLAIGEHRALHYKDLVTEVEAMTGEKVAGMDPEATLLANIARDPRIVGVGRRSGRYRLVEP